MSSEGKKSSELFRDFSFVKIYRLLSLLVAVLFAALPAQALAASLTIGFISFDTGAPVQGQNEISITNLTGLTYGCSAVDGLPVCDDLVLTNLVLRVNYNDVMNQQQQIVLTTPNSISPGTSVPPNFIFPGNETITSLTFSANVSQTSFRLTDNSIFQANSLVSSDPLVPGSSELGLLTVNPAAAATPEPTTFLLVFSAVALITGISRGRLR